LIMLLDAEHYKQGSAALANGKIVEVIPGTVEPVDIASLPASTLADEVDPISIARSYSELLALTARPSQPGLQSSLQLSVCGNNGAVDVLARKPGWISVAAKSVVAECLAITELPRLTEGRYYRIRFNMEMEAGGLTTTVIQDGKSTPVVSLSREVPLKKTSQSFVFQSTGGATVRLLLAANNVFGRGPARFSISQPIIEEVDVAR